MTEKDIRKTIWRGRFIRYAPLILWLAVIFINSSTSGSMSNTSRVIRPLLEFLFPHTPEDILVIYHGYIRKFAHFAEYAILAFFASRAFLLSSQTILRRFWFCFAFLFIAFVASVDECNQSFNPARTSSIYDVLIDCAGGAATIFLWRIYRLRKNNAPDNRGAI